eukprot:2521094-Ditylum_brightwellii.AAC.1
MWITNITLLAWQAGTWQTRVIHVIDHSFPTSSSLRISFPAMSWFCKFRSFHHFVGIDCVIRIKQLLFQDRARAVT